MTDTEETLEDSSEAAQREAVTNIIEQPKKNKGGRPKGKKTNQKLQDHKRNIKILELAGQNLPSTAIAKVVGVSDSNVRYIIEKYSKVFKKLEDVEEYRNIKGDLIDAAQLAVLESGLTDKKLNKAGLLSSMQALEILNKIGRLEKGLSTDNHRIAGFFRLDLTKPPALPTKEND